MAQEDFWPIVVFIAALVLFDYMLGRVITDKNARIAAGFALAAGASFIFVCSIRIFNLRPANRPAPDRRK